eukprot:g19579.t1
MRSTSREKVTVVTIIAAGAMLAPTIIFKGQSFNGDWVADHNGPPGAYYDCTESSFMCGDVFMKYIQNFHKQLGERNLLDEKPHLSSHMSHITLDVAGLGCFKKELAKVIQAFPARNGGALPRKRDMAGMIALAWGPSFTPEINKASFAGAGLWPVARERALSRLLRPKRKVTEIDRPRLEDVPITVTNERLEELIGDNDVRALRAKGPTTTGLRVSTVVLGTFLPNQNKRPKGPPKRANLGRPEGNLLSAPEWVAEQEKKDREIQAAEAAKAAKAAGSQERRGKPGGWRRRRRRRRRRNVKRTRTGGRAGAGKRLVAAARELGGAGVEAAALAAVGEGREGRGG